MLRAPMEKVVGMQEQMGNIDMEMKILRNSQEEMQEIKDCNKNEGL